MKKGFIVLGLAIAVVLHAHVPNAYALSCLPIDDYIDTTIGDETTQIFIGTATAVNNHTQVVTVTKALQGWVAPTVWVNHPWSQDWGYFCSNGPAPTGKSTIFLTTLSEHGTYSVTQTVAADSELGKKIIKSVADENITAGITEATPAERAAAVRESLINLIKVMLSLVAEMRYWESQSM